MASSIAWLTLAKTPEPIKSAMILKGFCLSCSASSRRRRGEQQPQRRRWPEWGGGRGEGGGWLRLEEGLGAAGQKFGVGMRVGGGGRGEAGGFLGRRGRERRGGGGKGRGVRIV